MIDSIYEKFGDEHQVDYDLDFVKKANIDFNAYLDSLDLDKSIKAKLNDCITSIICEYERQGFYYGFKEGINLQKELNNLA